MSCSLLRSSMSDMESTSLCPHPNIPAIADCCHRPLSHSWPGFLALPQRSPLSVCSQALLRSSPVSRCETGNKCSWGPEPVHLLRSPHSGLGDTAFRPRTLGPACSPWATLPAFPSSCGLVPAVASWGRGGAGDLLPRPRDFPSAACFCSRHASHLPAPLSFHSRHSPAPMLTSSPSGFPSPVEIQPCLPSACGLPFCPYRWGS